MLAHPSSEDAGAEWGRNSLKLAQQTVEVDAGSISTWTSVTWAYLYHFTDLQVLGAQKKVEAQKGKEGVRPQEEFPAWSCIHEGGQQ